MAIAPPLTRQVDIAVLSDLRLGAPNTQPEALLTYLAAIVPATLVLTGKFIEPKVVKAGRLTTPALRVILKLGEMAAAGTRIYILVDNEPKWLSASGNLLHLNCAVREELLLLQGGAKFFFGQAARPKRRLGRLREMLRGTRKSALLGNDAREQIGYSLAVQHDCSTCVLIDDGEALNSEVAIGPNAVRIVSPGSWYLKQEVLELRFGVWTQQVVAEPSLLNRIVQAGPTQHAVRVK